MSREQVINFFNELRDLVEEKKATRLFVGSPTSPAEPYEIMEALVYLQFDYNDTFYHVSINIETNTSDDFSLYYAPRKDDPGIIVLGKFRTKEEFLQLLE